MQHTDTILFINPYIHIYLYINIILIFEGYINIILSVYLTSQTFEQLLTLLFFFFNYVLT